MGSRFAMQLACRVEESGFKARGSEFMGLLLVLPQGNPTPENHKSYQTLNRQSHFFTN